MQNGVPENKAYEWTNYSIESVLDAYIVHKEKMKNSWKEQRREEQQQKALEAYVAKMVDQNLEACLEKALGEALKVLK